MASLARKALVETPEHDSHCGRRRKQPDPSCRRCRYLSVMVHILRSLPR